MNNRYKVVLSKIDGVTKGKIYKTGWLVAVNEQAAEFLAVSLNPSFMFEFIMDREVE